jgi:tetratricopeptide (TPR) repeat protein
VADEPGNDPAWRLIQLVRTGHSFSGRERNCVFLNTHGPRFANVSAVSGIDFPDDARAVARVDWDHDGDLDLWTSNRNAPQCRFLRNELPSSDNWIAVHLQGTTSNRDAIGAQIRITFADRPQPPITRRLVAGDGYLTQSSKWLHVGLGPSSDRCTVEVHWPTGSVSAYANLQVNRRYRLVEGIATAEVQPNRRVLPLSAKPLPLPERDSTLQVFSMVRPFLPGLEYLDEQLGARDVIEMKGEPILLVLWASWCPPCLHELAELTEQRQPLRDAGLRVLALSVDPLALDAQTNDAADHEVLRKLEFPFNAGRATPALLDKLQLANDFLFGLQQPFPVPTSVLIDKDFRLAAIYRGRVPLAKLQQDLENLAVSDRERRPLTVPFAGRWAEEPQTLSMAVFVMELLHAGFVQDASELVQRTQGIYDRATVLDLVVRLGMAHYERGSHERAELHFRMARRIEPTTVGPEIEQGQWHDARGEYREARRLFAEALSRNTRSLPALNNLAWLLATCPEPSIRDGAQAVKLARHAAQLTGSGHPGVLDTLAVSLAEAGRFDEAQPIAAQAAELARGVSQMNLAGQIEHRLRLFRQQQPYHER